MSFEQKNGSHTGDSEIAIKFHNYTKQKTECPQRAVSPVSGTAAVWEPVSDVCLVWERVGERQRRGRGAQWAVLDSRTQMCDYAALKPAKTCWRGPDLYGISGPAVRTNGALREMRERERRERGDREREREGEERRERERERRGEGEERARERRGRERERERREERERESERRETERERDRERESRERERESQRGERKREREL